MKKMRAKGEDYFFFPKKTRRRGRRKKNCSDEHLFPSLPEADAVVAGTADEGFRFCPHSYRFSQFVLFCLNDFVPTSDCREKRRRGPSPNQGAEGDREECEVKEQLSRAFCMRASSSSSSSSPFESYDHHCRLSLIVVPAVPR